MTYRHMSLTTQSQAPTEGDSHAQQLDQIIILPILDFDLDLSRAHEGLETRSVQSSHSLAQKGEHWRSTVDNALSTVVIIHRDVSL
jgi:hypothetical protein